MMGWGTFRVIVMLMMVVSLAACDSAADDSAPQELPTRVDLDAVATQDAIGTLTAQPTATVTSSGPTLPPTWTPTALITNTPAPPTPTPEVIDTGTIYYIYNDDSIIRINTDGSEQQFLDTFGVGALLTDLTLSPDGTLLAYIAPGSGSAREIFVSSLDGTFRQQISCLGFAEIRALSWSPDSASLAFIAVQSLGQIAQVYTANIAGSGNCPTDNNQQFRFSTEIQVPGDIAWSPDGTQLYYSPSGTVAYSLETGETTEELTQTLGFGADFAQTFHPNNPNQLLVLRREQSNGFGIPGGTPFLVDLSVMVGDFAQANPLPGTGVTDVAWSSDGRYIVMGGVRGVTLYDVEANSSRSLLDRPPLPPTVTFNDLTEEVIYALPSPENPAVEQIYSVSRRGGTPTQITFHLEGTVGDMVWVP